MTREIRHRSIGTQVKAFLGAFIDMLGRGSSSYAMLDGDDEEATFLCFSLDRMDW
jgi:hypothetical protein